MGVEEKDTSVRSVLLVDDHAIVRTAIAGLVATMDGWRVVGEADRGEVAIELVGRLNPDVVVMDVSMPGLGGIEATRRIVSEHKTAVLILSMHAEWSYAQDAMRAGARGFALKTSTPAEFRMALDAVARGESWLSPKIVAAVVGDLREVRPAQLTPRQVEVLRAIALGMSTRDIAQNLGVGVKTVETHRAKIMERLDIHNVAGLVRYVMKGNLGDG